MSLLPGAFDASPWFLWTVSSPDSDAHYHLVSPSVKLLRALYTALAHRLLGNHCFLGLYVFGTSGAQASMRMSRMVARVIQKAATAKPMSSGSINHRRLFVMANQSQERARLWRDCHSMSESLSTVSNVAMWALAVMPVDALPASQSFG